MFTPKVLTVLKFLYGTEKKTFLETFLMTFVFDAKQQLYVEINRCIETYILDFWWLLFGCDFLSDVFGKEYLPGFWR